MTDATTDLASDQLALSFEAQRAHMRAVAYRMLGSMAEADDVVQEAWLRYQRADASKVENLRGWLTTAVARLCLDALRSRRSRKEELMGFTVPDMLISAASGPDPEQQALLADSVGIAMLVVLDQLTPPERLAFVLHDVFGMSFADIAPIVDRSPLATRQLASRARRRVRGSNPDSDVDLGGQRRIVDAFLAAGRDGDLAGLIRILDPDAVVRADFGPKLAAASVEARGAENVAAQAMLFRRFAPGARPAIVNGTAGLVVFAGDAPYAVLGFTVQRDRIVEIDILADPERLARIDFTVLDA